MFDNAHEVGEAESRLLASIDERAIPLSTYPRQLRTLRYGDEDISSYAINLTFEKEKAKLACVLPNAYINEEHIDSRDALKHLWGARVVATTDTGEVFEAEYGYCTNRSFNFASDGGGQRVSILAREWQLIRTTPLLWAGRLDGSFPHGLGNLDLRVKTKDGSFHSRSDFALKGARWTYYLLARDEKRKKPNTLVIDTGGEKLDHHLLNNELQVLSYCLGQPLSCSFFVGLDIDGQSVAYAGGSYGFDRLRPNHYFSPVPRDVRTPWFIAFFQAITQKLAQLEDESRKQALYETINQSVESSSEINYISREVKATLACLAISRWFAGNITSLVKAPADWDKKIASSNILYPLATLGQEELLLSRVLAASRPGPIELIQLALREARLQPNQDLLDAVIQSSVLLSGQTFATNYKDSQSRCTRLRTLCAGLMATAVGYKGPLAGWESEEPEWVGEGITTTWIGVDPTTQPPYFTARVIELLPTANAVELWPTFQRPAIPKTSLVSLVENFALNLASRTDEQVRARILPLPFFNSDEPRLYDFILESARQPQANTVLFTIRQDSENAPLDILSWDEDVDTIKDERALTSFLAMVALAPRTRHAVERLLLVAPYEA
jgi:hypothetical protein